MRRGVLLTVAALLGAATWLALVPNDDPQSAAARVPAFWLVEVALVVVLVLLWRRDRPWLVGLCVGAPQVPLVFVSAPRGDNDGLWLLWVPLTMLLSGLLVAVAAVTGRVGRRR